jgi:hypothetical protein
MARRWWFRVLTTVGVSTLSLALAYPAVAGKARRRKKLLASMFAPSGQCVACHNGLTTADGQDVSIGVDWRSSMMANAARDPYWQAAVRRETLEHPPASLAIQDECSKCHMPMARYLAHSTGQSGRVFANLPVGQAVAPNAALAADGVSCSVCHQITGEQLGSPASFVGGFVIDATGGRGQRAVFGPYEVDRGRARVMRSSSGFEPNRGDHVRASELCATCHTLYTHSLDAGGQVVGELAEQVPYLEWRHSDYAGTRSCQSCHLPPLTSPNPISSVLPLPREGMSPHVFRGGNFFVTQVLNRYRWELGVTALPADLAATARRSTEQLQRRTAQLGLRVARTPGGEVRASVRVENLAGHKLPTAYPSRRVWIHFMVADESGTIVFESGRLARDGAIEGNDNDQDPERFEPHHTVIHHPDQVQIYEPILGDPAGRVTTGLLTATRYLKDNRILPRGFAPQTAPDDIAVRGAASHDADFVGGQDEIHYIVDARAHRPPFTVTAELWYQPIGHRWAQNLAAFAAAEPQRFVRYYESMADGSAVRVAVSLARTR